MSPMNNRRMTPMAEPGVLDFAPGAAAAYSLRNLSLSYAGPVVTVRRSTDSAEADFTAAEVSDGTLAAWCGGGDGFVKVWHDQSQNGNDASQASTARQPIIVDNGVLQTESGKPSVSFDGIDDKLDANPVASFFSGVDKPLTSLSVCKGAGVAATNFATWGLGNTTNNDPVRWCGQYEGLAKLANRDDAGGNDTTISGGDITTQSIVATYSTMDAANLHVNGAFQASFTDASGQTTLNTFSIGSLTRATPIIFWNGTISELIIYPTDQTALRTRIEGSLAWYY